MNESTSLATELQATLIILSLISQVFSFQLGTQGRMEDDDEVTGLRLALRLCDITRVEYDCDRLILYQ